MYKPNKVLNLGFKMAEKTLKLFIISSLIKFPLKYHDPDTIRSVYCPLKMLRSGCQFEHSTLVKLLL